MPAGDLFWEIVKENLYEEILVISRANPHADVLGGAGYYGLGTGAAFGQDYYNRSLSCNPSDPSCYNDYYRAHIRTHFPNCSTISLRRQVNTRVISARRPTASVETVSAESAKSATVKSAGTAIVKATKE